MTPIQARCVRCGGEFPLCTVVEEATGSCPRCFQPLVPGDRGALLEWAAAADAAHYRLCSALRFLQQIGGDLIVDWRSVVKSLAANDQTVPVAEVARANAAVALRPPHRSSPGQPYPFRQRHLRLVWKRTEPGSS
jgi:hypothetical protein